METGLGVRAGLTRTVCVAAAAASMGVMPPVRTASQSANSTFASFEPWASVGSEDLAAMNRGEILARSLPAVGRELAVFVAGSIDVDADAFIRGVRNSEGLWKGRRVPHVHRISIPPAAGDLEALELDEVDLADMRYCRVGSCVLKLAPDEIELLQQAIARAGPVWQPVVQQEFRRIILTRLQRFTDLGFTGLGAHDTPPVNPAETFLGLLNRSPWLSRSWPRVADYLRAYPRVALPGAEMLLYWMKSTFTPRPIIQAVQVVILPQPDGESGNVEVLVISRQVFATHYVDGSLSVSALLSDPANPSRRYLAYVNRTAVDALGGWLSGIKRFFLERRVRGAARALFHTQRDRIEQAR